MSHWNRNPDENSSSNNQQQLQQWPQQNISDMPLQVPETPITPQFVSSTPPPHMQRRNTGIFVPSEFSAAFRQQNRNLSNNNNAAAANSAEKSNNVSVPQLQPAPLQRRSSGLGAFTPVTTSIVPGGSHHQRFNSSAANTTTTNSSDAGTSRGGSPPRRPPPAGGDSTGNRTSNSSRQTPNGNDGQTNIHNNDGGGGGGGDTTPPHDMHFTPTRRQRSPERNRGGGQPMAVPETPSKSAARPARNNSNMVSGTSASRRTGSSAGAFAFGGDSGGGGSTPFNNGRFSSGNNVYCGETPARSTQRPASVSTVTRNSSHGTSSAAAMAGNGGMSAARHQRGNSDLTGMSFPHRQRHQQQQTLNRNPFSPGRDLMTTNIDVLSLNDPIHHALVVFQHTTGAQQQQQQQQQQHQHGTVSPSRRTLSPSASRRSPAISSLKMPRINSSNNMQNQQHLRRESELTGTNGSATDMSGDSLANTGGSINGLFLNGDQDAKSSVGGNSVQNKHLRLSSAISGSSSTAASGGGGARQQQQQQQQQGGGFFTEDGSNNTSQNNLLLHTRSGIDQAREDDGDGNQNEEQDALLEQEGEEEQVAVDDSRSRFCFFFPYPILDPNKMQQQPQEKGESAGGKITAATGSGKSNTDGAGGAAETEGELDTTAREMEVKNKQPQQQQHQQEEEGGEGADIPYTMVPLPVSLTVERNGAAWLGTAKLDGTTYTVKEVPFGPLDAQMLRQRDSARADFLGSGVVTRQQSTAMYNRGGSGSGEGGNNGGGGSSISNNLVAQEAQLREAFPLSVDDEIAALSMSRFTDNVVRFHSVQHDIEHQCHVIQTEYFGRGSLFEHWSGRRNLAERPPQQQQQQQHPMRSNTTTPVLTGQSGPDMFATGGSDSNMAMAGPPPPPPAAAAISASVPQQQQQQQQQQQFIEVFVCPSEAEVWRALHDVSRGLMVLHRNGFAHNNLHPRSVFVDAGGRCKIGCFGVAKKSRGVSRQQQQSGGGSRSNDDADGGGDDGVAAAGVNPQQHQQQQQRSGNVVCRSTDSVFLALPSMYEPPSSTDFGTVPSRCTGDDIRKRDGSQQRQQQPQEQQQQAIGNSSSSSNNNSVNNSVNDEDVNNVNDTSLTSLNSNGGGSGRNNNSSSSGKSAPSRRSIGAVVGQPVTLAQLQARDVYSFAAGLVHTLYVCYMQAERNEVVDLRAPGALSDRSCLADCYNFVTKGCGYSPALGSLLSQLLALDDTARPTACQVVMRISGNRPACTVREAFCDSLRGEIFALQERLRKVRRAATVAGGSNSNAGMTTGTLDNSFMTLGPQQSSGSQNPISRSGDNTQESAGSSQPPDSYSQQHHLLQLPQRTGSGSNVTPHSLFMQRLGGSSGNLNEMLQQQQQQQQTLEGRVASPLGAANLSPQRTGSFQQNQQQQQQQQNTSSRPGMSQQGNLPLSFPSQPSNNNSMVNFNSHSNPHHHLFEERSGTPILAPDPAAAAGNTGMPTPTSLGPNANNNSSSTPAGALGYSAPRVRQQQQQQSDFGSFGSRSPVNHTMNANNMLLDGRSPVHARTSNNGNTNNNVSGSGLERSGGANNMLNSPSSSHLDEDAEVSHLGGRMKPAALSLAGSAAAGGSGAGAASGSQQQQQKGRDSTTPWNNNFVLTSNNNSAHRGSAGGGGGGVDLSQSPIERDPSFIFHHQQQNSQGGNSQDTNASSSVMGRPKQLGDIQVATDILQLASFNQPSSPLFGLRGQQHPGAGGARNPASSTTRPNSPSGLHFPTVPPSFPPAGPTHTPTTVGAAAHTPTAGVLTRTGSAGALGMMMFPSSANSANLMFGGGGANGSSSNTMMYRESSCNSNSQTNAASPVQQGPAGPTPVNASNNNNNSSSNRPESPLQSAQQMASQNPQEYQHRVMQILAQDGDNRLQHINDNADCSEWLLKLRDPNVARPARPLSVQPVNFEHPHLYGY